MISKLVDFALRRRVTTAMVVLILCVTGFLSLRRLDTDFMPDIELPSVSVLTLYPGAPPEEMESIVTRPVEQAVNRIRGIRKVRSASTEGLSIVYAEFDWGIELDFAAQEVRDTVGRARAAFPDGVRESLVVKFNLTDFPIMMGGITADIPILELKRKVEDEAVPRLSRIDGVASVLVYSREVREILVDLDMSALDSLGLSIEQVVLALRSANRNVPAGRLDEGSREVLVRALGEFTGLDEIRDTVVGLTAAGGPIAVKDVGTVRDGVKDTGLIYRTGGRKGLMFKVQKRSGANTVRTTRAVREEMARIESSFPGNIRFSPRFDQGLIIERVLEETRKDGLFGGLLAIAFILLFLRSARSTLIVALAIPFSVVTTFIALLAAGASINLLTLGGLALGVGMLVDNAVVVVENIHRYAEAGASRFEAARRGTSEVGAAITVGTLTNIIVFLPIVFAAGLTGRLNRALAMSISFSLLASLVVALTLVPLAAAVLMKDGSPRRRTPAGRQSPLFDAVRKAYRKGLERALRRRGPILAATVLLILLSGALLLSLGREFLPTMDPDWLIFLVRLPVGTAATETDRAVRLAEQILSEEPGVESISAQVGSAAEVSPEDLAGAFSTSGPNEGMIVVGLARGRRRDDSGARIVERVRSRFPRTEGWELKAVDIVQEMTIGSRAEVEIMIRGKDLGILTAAADRIVERMRTIPGLRDAAHTMSARRPEYHIRLLRDSAGRLGITAGQLGSAVRAATLGLVATRLHEEAGGTDIRVRVSKRDISGPKELGAISVPNPKRLAEAEALAVRFQAEGTAPAGTLENALPVGSAGALAEPPAAFRVDQIATVRKGQGPILIQRENQARQVTVMANISGRDLGSVVKDIRPVLAEVANGLPPGTTVEFGGQYTEMQETLSIMAGAILLAALLMFMLIAAEFESFLQPLIIMATVPLGFIGVVAAVFLSGKTLSLPVLVGFIILEGIADNNAIVMIESINRLKAAGMDHRAAIVEGSAIRLRPVLITALTTVLGVLPMAFRAGSGTELRSPMAVAVLGGLVVTTFMTLFIVPILLSLTGRSGGRAGESVP